MRTSTRCAESTVAGGSADTRAALPGRGVPRPRPSRARGDEPPRCRRVVRDEPREPLLPDRVRVDLVPATAPLGVVVSRHEDRLVFLDYERHETLVRNTALVDDAVFYRYEDALESIATVFAKRVERGNGRYRMVDADAGWATRARDGRAVGRARGTDRRRRLDRRSRSGGQVRSGARVHPPSGGDRRCGVRKPARQRPAGSDGAPGRRAWTVPWRIRAASRRPFGRWSRQAPTSGTGRTRRRRGARWKSATSCTSTPAACSTATTPISVEPWPSGAPSPRRGESSSRPPAVWRKCSAWFVPGPSGRRPAGR